MYQGDIGGHIIGVSIIQSTDAVYKSMTQHLDMYCVLATQSLTSLHHHATGLFTLTAFPHPLPPVTAILLSVSMSLFVAFCIPSPI